MKLKKLFSIILVTALFASAFSGCIRTKFGGGGVSPSEQITLTMYGLYDSPDIYEPLIQSYQGSNTNITINYKKFTDSEDYLDLIINELAEGEGPDIFMMHNTWVPKHYKKLTPAPSTIVDPDVFRSLFVDIAGDELIIPNEENVEQVWGLPLYVDTLALYYNDEYIEEVLPSQGQPSSTWEGIANDVTALNRDDQSFSRFERAGIALGRSDNILRAFDTLAMMMLQYGVDFYNDDLTEVIFNGDPNAIAALDLFTSFALPSQKNYSWNQYLADADSAEKEITTFASGQVAMILGYSYIYEDIINEIQSLTAQGEDTIDINDVKIQEVPQVFDPETTAETREAYASYFVPVVSRTSEHSQEAWEFLATLVDEENLRYYNEETHRPSALRSLIDEQTLSPIYGVFASQVGYAESFPMSDPEAYEEAFLNAIQQILDTARTEDVLRNLASEIQSLITSDGIKPIYVPTD